MSVLAREYELNIDRWKASVDERLEQLEGQSAPKSEEFRSDYWYPIGRFNALYTKGLFVELGSTGDEVRINDLGIQIDTRASTAAPRLLSWYYNDGSGPKRVGAIYGAYGVAEQAAFMRIDARRSAGDTPTNAQLTINAYNLENGHSLGIWMLSDDPDNSNRPTMYLYGDIYVNGTKVYTA